MEGLEPNYGGKAPELSQDEKEELKEILEKRDDWSTKEVEHLIEEFSVDYSERHDRFKGVWVEARQALPE